MNLNMFAPVEGPTGYDHVARRLIAALVELGVNIKLFAHTAWCPSYTYLESHEFQMLQALMNNRSVRGYDPWLHICLPDQVDTTVDAQHFNLTMFEALPPPKHWIELGNTFAGTFLPGQFGIDLWSSAGADVSRLSKIMFAPDDAAADSLVPLHLYDSARGLPLNELYPIRILIVGEDTARKNVRQAVVSVFDAFRGRDDVCCTVKTASYTSMNCQSLHDFILELKGGAATPPVFFLYPRILSDFAMLQLMQAHTHYLSVSHGEGWDMSAMQMLALGKEIIVPFHTGYQEYCDDNNAWLLKRLSRVPVTGLSGKLGALYKDSEWFDIDMDECIAKLKAATSLVPKNTAQAPICNECQWSQTAHKIVRHIEEFSE